MLAKVAAGGVDVLIGTHRILSKDVVFRDLGLLVVDEEQRFGVAAKEKLKQLKTSVDGLTLSATPIPRTLQMGLAASATCRSSRRRRATGSRSRPRSSSSRPT